MSELVFDGGFEGLPSASPVSRRNFIVSLLGAGFALAVRPVRSETLITTDAEGLLAGEVKIPVADGELPAYRAAPKGAGPHPVVLVVQEIFGVHEHIKDVTRRLAKLGYLAIAPELYARQGDVSKLASIDEIRQVVAKVPDAQVLADLDASVEWAGNNGGDLARLGITGFCWGGRITWLYAAHQPKLKAAVAWYGRVKGPSSELNPRQPLDVAAELKAPVLGLYGGQDQGIPVDTLEELRAAIKAAGGTSKIHIYPDAPHALLRRLPPELPPGGRRGRLAAAAGLVPRAWGLRRGRQFSGSRNDSQRRARHSLLKWLCKKVGRGAGPQKIYRACHPAQRPEIPQIPLFFSGYLTGFHGGKVLANVLNYPFHPMA